MAVIGSAYVDIRAIDTKFQGDVDKAVSRIKDVTLNLRADINLKPVRDKISALRAELRANPLKFSAEVDMKRVHDSINEVRETHESDPLLITTEADTIPFEQSLDYLRARYKGMHTSVFADAKTALAEATLARVARERRATIHVDISRQSTGALKALAYTVAGALPADKIRDSFTGIATNLESIMLKAASASAGIGALSAAVLTLGANALSIGADVVRVAQIAAVAPAAFSAMAVSVIGLTAAWKGFGKAVSGDAEALAKLPVEAQNAARALKGTWTQITNPAKASFWKEMNTALQDTVSDLIPGLTRGFEKTNVSLAKMTKGALASFSELAKSGGLDTLFNNIDAGLNAASRGIKPFFDAFNRLSVSGSKYLERFGNAFGDLGERFNNFITKADQDGRLDEWITRGINGLKDMGSILGSSGDIMAGLSAISEVSGGQGLDDLAAGLKDVAATVNSEPFQSKLISIMKMARQGTDALKDGFGDLANVVANGTGALGNFLKTAGQIVGKLFSSIATMFEGTGLSSGLLEALWGLEDALVILEPGFRNLGQIIGDMGEFAGAFFKAVAPGINNLMETLAAVVAALKDGLIAVMPILNDFMQGFLQAAAPIIVGIAEAVGFLLESFAGLPRVLQMALLAFLAFLLVKDRVLKFFGEIGAHASNMGDRIRKTFATDATSSSRTFASVMEGNRQAAERSSSGVRAAFANVGSSAIATGVITETAFRRSFSQLGTWATNSLDTVSSAYSRHLAGPVASFQTGLSEGFKQTFSQVIPYEVKDGFARVGANIENAYTTARGHTLNFADAVKREFSLLPVALKEFPAAVGDAFGHAYDQGARRMTLLGEMVKERTVYAASHFQNLSQSFINGPVRDIREGSTAIGNHIRAMVSPIETAVNNAGQAVARGYNNMVVAGTVQATVLKREFGQAFSTIGSEFSRVFTPIGEGAVRTFSAVSNAGRVTGQAISNTFSSAASNIRTSFAPLGGSIGGIFRDLGGVVRTAGEHVATLGRNAATTVGQIGAQAGKGLAGAASGLMGALGGPWGLAIGAATVAITAFGQAQADSKARVDEFSKTLNQQTGEVTAATEKMMAAKLFDGVTDGWDDFVRGFGEQSMSVEETLDTLGISTKKYADTMKDPSSRDSYIKGMREVSETLKAGRLPSDELVRSLGMSTEAFKNLNSYDDKRKLGNSLNYSADKAEDMAEEVARAEANVKRLAEAMGTTTETAAIMQRNFETLGSKTTSVSDKFRALKENMELHGSSTQKVQRETKAYQEQLQGVRDKIAAFTEENKQAVTTLYEVGKGFDFTSKSGRDLHSIIESQTDSILNLGTAAMDKALKGGADAASANKAAMEAMMPAIDGLKSTMRDIGLSEPQINDIIKSFGLLPEDLIMSMGVEGGDKARQEIFLTEMASKAFASGNYTAVLAALPEAAKTKIGEALGMGKEFKDGDYQAILDALDKTQGGKESALLNILSVTNGDYSAVLKAKDSTAPQVESARREINTVTGKTVEISVNDKTTGTVNLIKTSIAGIERYVKVTVDTIYLKPAGAGGNPTQMANGGIISAGSMPLAKSFANGGLENHVAQISRGQTPFRIWSEPETGGEAYIPLSPAKRPRSLKILEEVARLFGMSLFKNFANGGVLSGFETKAASPLKVTTTSSVVNSAPVRAGAGNTTYINTTINPSQGLSEAQIGLAAATEIFWQLDR